MPDPLAPRIDWVVFDLGETLVDETAKWARWADYLDVSAPTFFAALGAAIAMRRHHHHVFNIIRPGFSLAEEAARWDVSALGREFGPSDLYDDALPALAELRESGYRLAIMANQPTSLPRSWRRCRWIAPRHRKTGPSPSRTRHSLIGHRRAGRTGRIHRVCR
jgi:FMN phosphatase YigB (HAD superfamily)